MLNKRVALISAGHLTTPRTRHAPVTNRVNFELIYLLTDNLSALSIDGDVVMADVAPDCIAFTDVEMDLCDMCEEVEMVDDFYCGNTDCATAVSSSNSNNTAATAVEEDEESEEDDDDSEDDFEDETSDWRARSRAYMNNKYRDYVSPLATSGASTSAAVSTSATPSRATTAPVLPATPDAPRRMRFSDFAALAGYTAVHSDDNDDDDDDDDSAPGLFSVDTSPSAIH